MDNIATQPGGTLAALQQQLMQINPSYVPGINQQVGGGSENFANLGRDELNALIQYRQQVLAAQQAAAAQQEALARAQMGQQESQFGRQLFFNEQAQRAGERYQTGQLDLARGAQSLEEILSRNQQRLAGLGGAAQEGLARQQLALSGFGQAEAARLAAKAQQDQQALAVANLVGSLRGPSNAFKQLEVNMGLNRAGQSNLLGALAGQWGVPAYTAPGGQPEAASLATMARDAGAQYTPGMLDPAQAAGIQGMLGVAGQNAGIGGGPDTWLEQMRFAKDQENRVMQLQPGQASLGAQLYDAWAGILARNGGNPPAPDAPEIIGAWQRIAEGLGKPISAEQARTLALYAHHYAATRGVPMHEGQLNDMFGQVLIGAPIEATKWRDPGPRSNLPPGTPDVPAPLPGQPPGTPPATPPGTPPTTPPGQPPTAPPTTPPSTPPTVPPTTPPGYTPTPGQTPVPPPAGPPPAPQPPPAPISTDQPGPVQDIAARVMPLVQVLAQQGRTGDDAAMVDVWVQAGATREQAMTLHAYAKEFFRTQGRALAPSQINDMYGQVVAGQPPSAAGWRPVPAGGGAQPTQPSQPAQPQGDLESMIANADQKGIISGAGEAAQIRANAGAFADLTGWDDFVSRLRQGVHRTGGTQTTQATVGPALPQPQGSYTAPTSTAPNPTPQPSGETFTWTGSEFVGTGGSRYARDWTPVGGGNRLTFGTAGQASGAVGGEKPGWDYTDQAAGRFTYSPR